MADSSTTITCFMAAICRDLAEGGDGYRYFGSLGTWTRHQHEAIKAELLDAEGALTTSGRLVGKACSSLPDGRAYFFSDQYVAAAKAALNV